MLRFMLILIIAKTRRKLTGLEKLFHDVFVVNTYNRYVRPVDEFGMTNIQTQLKLLQIDLVSIYIQCIYLTEALI